MLSLGVPSHNISMQASWRVTDWFKGVVVAVAVSIVMGLWFLFRPIFARFLWYILDYAPEKKAQLFFAVFEDKAQQPRLKTLAESLFSERMNHVDESLEEALNGMHENRDDLAWVKESVTRQGETLREVKDVIKVLPQLLDTIGRIADSSEKNDGRLDALHDLASRMDERQKNIEKMVERRLNQAPEPHPHRRGDDR